MWQVVSDIHNPFEDDWDWQAVARSMAEGDRKLKALSVAYDTHRQ
jgi:hypothetical protein